MPDDANSLELSRRLVYLAAERTLTSWIRTALSLMALGFVIDRFGLILHMLPAGSTKAPAIYPRILSVWGGSILIAMGALMALVGGLRYLFFSLAYHRESSTRVRHGILIASAFSLVLALFGIALVVLLTVIVE